MSDLLRWAYDYLSGGEPMPPKAPAPIGKLPNLTREQWFRLAAAARQLTPQQRAALPPGVNPNNVRSAVDHSTADTNLAGWVDPRAPQVMFFRPNPFGNQTPGFSIDGNPGTLQHEATHTWQHATGDRYYSRNLFHMLNGYNYETWHDKLPFTSYSDEEQGTMVADGVPVALNFLQSHPAPSIPDPAPAMLDALKQYLQSHKDLQPLPIHAVRWKGNGSSPGVHIEEIRFPF